jgi:hypothetical protein
MANNASIQYINSLGTLLEGDLSILRTLKYKDLDESLDGFDLFTSLWWPLREQNQFAPRRDVAWLIVKAYAGRPIPHREGANLPALLGMIYYRRSDNKKDQLINLFDKLLSTNLDSMELYLDQCLATIQSEYNYLDWVWLLDKLSIWENPQTREQWAQIFVNTNNFER